MKSCEPKIDPRSDYYVYAPSLTAKEIFFYPLQCGHFIYQPGYALSRENFDSFLLMYVERGEITVKSGEYNNTLLPGHFLFLDCYKPHSYATKEGCECLWCHFDGVLARGYHRAATAQNGIVFAPRDSYLAREKIKAVCDMFQRKAPIKEPLISKYLNDLLTSFLLYSPQKDFDQASISETATAFIRENFAREISIGELARYAGLSPWHFIRVFKQETGLTPHQYLMDTRIAAAKYLLKNSSLSTKNICFATGFSCESVFCSAFKKHEGITPGMYRSAKVPQ